MINLILSHETLCNYPHEHIFKQYLLMHFLKYRHRVEWNTDLVEIYHTTMDDKINYRYISFGKNRRLSGAFIRIQNN